MAAEGDGVSRPSALVFREVCGVVPEPAPAMEERRPNRDRVVRVIRWLLARVEADMSPAQQDGETPEEVRQE